MNAAELRDHLLSFLGAEETFPFGPNTSVFKVSGKMFALSQLGGGSLPQQTLEEMIEDSYDLVVSQLPRSRRPPGWQGP